MTQLPVDLIKSRRRCCHLQLAFLFQFHRTNLFGALHCIATSTQRQTAAKWTSNNLHGTADHGIEALQHRAAGNKLPVYSHTVCVPNSKSQAKSRNGYVLFSKYSHTRGQGQWIFWTVHEEHVLDTSLIMANNYARDYEQLHCHQWQVQH
jgi:hypothetical protein